MASLSITIVFDATQRYDEMKSIVRHLSCASRLLMPSANTWSAIILAMLLSAAFGMLEGPLVGKYMNYLVARNWQGSYLLIPIMASATLGCVAFWSAAHLLTTRIADDAGFRLREALIRKAYRVPLATCSQWTEDKLNVLLNVDIANVTSALYVLAQPVVSAAVSVVFCIGMLLYLNTLLAAISSMLVPIWAILLWHMGRQISSNEVAVSTVRESMAHYAGEHLSFTGIVRATAADRKHQHESYLRADACALRALGSKARSLSRRQYIQLSVSTCLVTSGLLVVALNLTFNGVVSNGTVVASIFLLGALQYPITMMSSAQVHLASLVTALDRLSVVLDAKEVVSGCVSVTAAPIVATDLCFSYDEKAMALSCVSLMVEEGEKVAILGSSGSGKSTLGLLLQGLYRPTSGYVTIGGYPIEQVDESCLRRIFAYYFSGDRLFQGTLRDNICYGQPTGTDAELWEALRIAQALEVVSNLRAGLDAVIGPKQERFSTGQVQRLCLARTIAKRSPILVLDEPTSALDATTERAIFDALRAIKRTMIILTHQEAVADWADRIYTLDAGQIECHRDRRTSRNGLTAIESRRTTTISA